MLFEWKNVKTTIKAHAFKCYTSFYNVKVLRFFDPKLQLKDTESAIKNKLKKLLTELREFKFSAWGDRKWRKTKNGSKVEITINESDIDDNVFIWLNLYYSYMKHTKFFRKRFRLDFWFIKIV